MMLSTARFVTINSRVEIFHTTFSLFMNVCKFTFVNLLIPQEYHFVFTFTLHVQQKRIKYTCFVQEKGGRGGSLLSYDEMDTCPAKNELCPSKIIFDRTTRQTRPISSTIHFLWC